jgi:hypothetical protein
LLLDKGKDKYFLANKIKEMAKNGDISKRPIIVIDGEPYRYDYELKNAKLKISKDDIKQIDRVKLDVGIKIYGEAGKNGVLLITTKSDTTTVSKSFDKSKVLILLEDKEISKEEMNK